MNRTIKLLILSGYLWGLGEGLLGPLYAVFAQRIGGDIFELTGAYAMYLLASGIITILLSRAADRWSMKRLAVYGLTLNAVATFAYVAVDSPWKLFVVQAMLGVAFAMAAPPWEAMFSRNLEKGKEVSTWGLYNGGSSILLAGATVLGGVIVTYWSFSILFLMMGIIQSATAITQSAVLFEKDVSLS